MKTSTSRAPVPARSPARPADRTLRARAWRVLAPCLLACAGAVHADSAPVLSPARTAAEANLVDMRTLVPDFAEDIKYAGSDNFVGRPVDGYRAAKCLLLQPAAMALARVERELRKEQLRLLAYDCYRPVRAVADFVRWGHDLADQGSKAAHYPRVDKADVFRLGYVATVSGHSRGATIDLTLERCADGGASCVPLDMGTPFDFFDLRAHTDAADVTPIQRANRRLLRRAMERGGFRNYPSEWWHYSLTPEPTPRTLYDVPVE